MCGIAGWIDWERDLTHEEPSVRAMAETLACRGPDASGTWLSGHAALAHRRLIVIDPEGGGQPMSRRRGDHVFTLVYNGELYNTAELRSDLIAKGHTFRGHSDTEALLRAYMEWGVDCVHHFNGIFAFAVWDSANQRLVMARDRLGVKPLFYRPERGSLLFGSELKAILAHPSVDPEVDADGLGEIFALGPARTPGHGVYRGVHEVKPGHVLISDRRGSRTYPYWSLESRPHSDDSETTARTVHTLLKDAVERQLVSDVPICTLLSGGLDSSALTAFAAAHFDRQERGPLHTYSIDYHGNDVHFKPSAFQPNSDAEWVRVMSDTLGTTHHVVTLDNHDLAQELSTAVKAQDLPGMADVSSSLFLFCREIKKEFTVALSGECADEMFGGYPWFHRPEMLEANTFPWSRALDHRESWLAPEVRKAVRVHEYAEQRYRETLAEVPRLDGESPSEARIREIFYLNYVWFMVTLLNRKDRMSMACGLEVRVPFCDHRLVEYVWNIPWSMKTYGGREKGILRKALEGVLPEGVLYRKKSPYPKTHNPVYLHAVRKRLLEILDDSDSPILPLLDIEKIRAMALAQDDTFDTPWFGQLMTGPQLYAYLIEVNTWLAHYNVRIRLS